MDGLNGKEPTSEYREYTDGWLAGTQDKESGFIPPKYFGPIDNLPLKRGDEVIIPKGTKIYNTNLGG